MEFCVECCLSSCKEYLNYCFQDCKNGVCEKCEELLNICKSNCVEVPSESVSFFYKCLEENGCGEYPFFDKDCVERKKKEIKACYLDFCSPLNKQKCIEDVEKLNKNLFISLELNKKKERKRKKGNFFPIFFIILLLLIFFFLLK